MTLRLLMSLALFSVLVPAAAAAEPAKPPNIVFIMADDLGMYELGCYGQKKIRTPSIDKLAAEGMRFTQFYTGNAVCAPSRCCLMTGKHAGHAVVRTNVSMKPEGQYPIPADTVTVAKLLKAKGYATGATGKWGLGNMESEGNPLKQGFDMFFGYNCQAHAHNHYPTWLWKNDKKITLEGNDGGDTGKTYSHDLMEAEALEFIKANKDKPFFLYVPFTISHLALQVPDDSLNEYKGKWEEIPYKGKAYRPHDFPRAAYAGMVTRMDRSVGRFMDLIKQLKLDDNTIVFFTSDNGPIDQYAGTDSTFFGSLGQFRGMKGSLYEGGIRTPFIARWPGKIKPGSTSDLLAYFPDVLPTLAALAGAETPKAIDGISIVPTLLGKGAQSIHEFLYWEFPSYGGQQAVRAGDWKAVRQDMQKGKIVTELYNLKDDIGEKNNVATKNPEVVQRLERILKEQHTPSETFPIKALGEGK
ncbi:MAG: arylsulfatase [Planctomycetes bacterium]|nr:arylsulfatase [Planctomycetota bacterium]